MIIQNYSFGTYLILFSIILRKTGLVVTPYLPGDTLLFAALGSIDIKLLIVIVSAAAVLGNTTNFTVGNSIGNKIYEMENVKLMVGFSTFYP